MDRIVFWAVMVVVGWTAGFLVNSSAQDSDLHWTVATSTGKRAIARTLAGDHRILLVGGSHTHYSLSSEQISEEVGCPTANLGTHAGLGLMAILEDSNSLVRRGDLVVVTPEYRTLADKEPGWLAAGFGAATGRLGLGGRDTIERVHLAVSAGMSTLTSVGKSLWTLVTGQRGRTEPRMNGYGDTTVFYDDVKPVAESQMKLESAVGLLAGLRRYRDELAARGGVLVFNLPAMLTTWRDDTTRRSVETMVEQLKQIAPVLAHDGRLNLSTDPALFSDSPYHLTAAGRAGQSHRLAKELASTLEALHWKCGRL